MEANLNQFRLLTVRGEQEANCRRGSRGRVRPVFDAGRKSSLPGGGESESNGSPAGSACVSPSAARNRPSTPPSSPRRVRRRRRPATSPRRTTSSDDDDEVLPASDEVENEATEADRGDVEQSLVVALTSLERTIAEHTQQLTKRLRRELTVKGASSETTAQTGVGSSSSLPAKSGQRGDKVDSRTSTSSIAEEITRQS